MPTQDKEISSPLTAGIPPFLQKTWEIVEEASQNGNVDCVKWCSTGTSFIVTDTEKFAKEILPKYFKHSNWSSFVRQLNTYGFRKIDPDRWMFANECFVRGRKDLLQSIQRRKPSTISNHTLVQCQGEELSHRSVQPQGSWPAPALQNLVPGQVPGFSALHLPFPVAAPMNTNIPPASAPLNSVLGQLGGLPNGLGGFGLSPSSWQLDISAWQQQLMHSSHPLPLVALPEPQPAPMMGATNVDLPAGATTCSHEETRACGASASSGLDRLAALACEYFLPEQEKLSSTSSRQQEKLSSTSSRQQASSNSALSSGPSTSQAAGQRSADLESCDRADINSGCRHDFKHKGSKRTRVSSEGVKEELLLSSMGPVGNMYEGGGEPGADTHASENCTPGSSSMDKEEPGIPSNLQSGPHSLVSIHEHLFHPDAQDLHQQELHHEATVDVSPKDFVSQQQERIRVIEAELVRTHQQTQLAEERTRCLEAKNQELGTRLARQEEVNLDQRRMNNMLEARLSELENQLKGRQESMLKGLEEGVKKLLSEYLDRNSNDLDSTTGGFPEPLARDRSNVKDSSSF